MKNLDSAVYQKVSIADLILAVISSLSGNEISFGKILRKCFELSPAKFGFSELKMPDSRKIDRPLRLLKEHKFVESKDGNVFRLTKKGKDRALVLANFFRQKRLII